MSQIYDMARVKIYIESLKTIRESIKQGTHEISGCLSGPDSVIVTHKTTWDTTYIPLETWIKTDQDTFDYGQTSALIDSISGEGLVTDGGPYLPDMEIEAMQQRGFALEAEAYWAGYKSV